MIICFSRCYVFNYCRVEQNTSNETRARNKPEVIRINDFSKILHVAGCCMYPFLDIQCVTISFTYLIKKYTN